MAIRKVILGKKINNTIYEIFPKTSADAVIYGESTVAKALASFATDLSNVYKNTEVDEAIRNSADSLYNKIMGITSEDSATVTEAYDTLKEVAAWIDENGETAAGFTNDISSLKTAVSALQTGLAEANAAIEGNDTNIKSLQTAVTALETAVGNAESGLVKDMADAKAAIEDHETRIDELETTIGDENSGLVKQVSELSAVSGNHTEASETNGNIKIDNNEVVVYTHPETHSANMIEEEDERKFVTATEKNIIANAAAVTIVSSQDEVINENDLYLIEIID